MDGLITAIQRMSIHDGPGIRTTVFLKGCDLQCKWCHNPETISPRPQLEWISNKCINCHSCIEVCPSGALSDDGGILSLRREACTVCFDCIPECCTKALNQVGRRVSATGVYEEIIQDLPFFKRSDGGITISGGEPMLQWKFVQEILRQCVNNGIHTALDTNMTASWKLYREVLPFARLILADLKIIDPDVHRQWTGSGNQRILENIRLLDQTAIPYIVRTPVIPGVNDSEQEMERIMAFVSGLRNLRKFELLPYHALGSIKYANLGMKNPMNGVSSMDKKELKRFDQLKEKYRVEGT